MLLFDTSAGQKQTSCNSHESHTFTQRENRFCVFVGMCMCVAAKKQAPKHMGG